MVEAAAVGSERNFYGAHDLVCDVFYLWLQVEGGRQICWDDGVTIAMDPSELEHEVFSNGEILV